MPVRSFHILGIDPGASGALAHIEIATSRVKRLSFLRMPLAEGEINVKALVAYLDTIPSGTIIVLEQLASHGGKVPPPTILAMGRNLGLIEAALKLRDLGYRRIQPQAWQALVGTPRRAKGAKGDRKDLHLAAAQRYFPKTTFIPERCTVFHDGVVDATCIALAGALDIGILRPIG